MTGARPIKSKRNAGAERLRGSHQQRGGTSPFQNWSENNTDHCIEYWLDRQAAAASLCGVRKRLSLDRGPRSVLGCDLIYAKVMCSSTVRDMMDRGMNFAMYILVIHRYQLIAFAGFTCHNAQCYRPVQNLYPYWDILRSIWSRFFFNDNLIVEDSRIRRYHWRIELSSYSINVRQFK